MLLLGECTATLLATPSSSWLKPQPVAVSSAKIVVFGLKNKDLQWY